MTNKEEVLKDERRLQRACDKYIHHEGIIYCVSTLMYELREVAEKLDDYDTYLTLTGGVPDYEEAARYFISDSADLDQLEEIAEECDCWSNVFDRACGRYALANATATQVASMVLLKPFYDDAGKVRWSRTGTDDGRADDDVSTADWCEYNPGLEKQIREAVQDALDNADAESNQWVCNEYDLDPDYREVYEHWIVSRYLGSELGAQGELVEEFLGLNIWGRTTTGQAISMDYVIRQIVQTRDEDHWVWREV